METIMGFVAGYLAGSQDGKDGVERIRTSLIAIKDSAEVRRLAGEAMTFAEMAFRRIAGAGLGGTVGTVTDVLVQRATAAAARRETSRAA
jgi:hypothetical protein